MEDKDLFTYKLSGKYDAPQKLEDVKNKSEAEAWVNEYYNNEFDKFQNKNNNEELFQKIKYTYTNHSDKIIKNWKNGGEYIYAVLKQLLDYAVKPPSKADAKFDKNKDIFNYVLSAADKLDLPRTLPDISKIPLTERNYAAIGWAEEYFGNELEARGSEKEIYASAEKIFQRVKYTYDKHKNEILKDWKKSGQYIYKALNQIIDYSINIKKNGTLEKLEYYKFKHGKD